MSQQQPRRWWFGFFFVLPLGLVVAAWHVLWPLLVAVAFWGAIVLAANAYHRSSGGARPPGRNGLDWDKTIWRKP